MLTKITDDLWLDLDEINSIDFLYDKYEDECEYRFDIIFKDGVADAFYGKDKYEAMKKALEERYNKPSRKFDDNLTFSVQPRRCEGFGKEVPGSDKAV